MSIYIFAFVYTVIDFIENLQYIPNGEISVRDATIHIIVDNFLDGLYFNEQYIGNMTTTNYTTFTVNVNIGLNLMVFDARNSDYIGGCIVSVIRKTDNVILLHSDGTWKFTQKS